MNVPLLVIIMINIIMVPNPLMFGEALSFLDVNDLDGVYYNNDGQIL